MDRNTLSLAARVMAATAGTPMYGVVALAARIALLQSKGEVIYADDTACLVRQADAALAKLDISLSLADSDQSQKAETAAEGQEEKQS